MTDRDEQKPEIELFDGSLDSLDDAAQQPPTTPSAPASQEPIPDLDDDDQGGLPGDAGEAIEGDATTDADGSEAEEDAALADEPEAEVEADEDLDEVEDAADAESEEAEPLTEEEEGELAELQEEIGAYREANDIPATAADYQLPPEAAALEDSPLLAGFLEQFHEDNLSQETVGKILTRYAATAAEIAAGNSERDVADAGALKSQIEEAWGDDYAGNIKAVKQLLGDAKALPAGVGKAILQARQADGSRLVNSRPVLEFLVATAKAKLGDGRQQRKDRIREIEAVRDRDTSEYFAKGMSEELIALTTAEAANAPAEPRSADAQRLAHIERVMATDMSEYWRQGLDKEFAELIGRKQQRGAR